MNLTKTHTRGHTSPALAKSSARIGLLFVHRGHRHASHSMRVFLWPSHACYGGAFGGVLAPVVPVYDKTNSVRPATLMIGLVCVVVDLLLHRRHIMPNHTPQIRLVDGTPVTTSKDIAETFGKRHDDVLRKIASLDCSANFTARNFAASEYEDSTGRKLKCYQITRDGFTFLAMGFTGKRAAQFKEAYIEAFNELERKVHPTQQVSNDIADAEKYRLLNNMIRSMGFINEPVVVPVINVVHLVQTVRYHQQQIAAMQTPPMWMEDNISQLKQMTGLTLLDDRGNA